MKKPKPTVCMDRPIYTDEQLAEFRKAQKEYEEACAEREQQIRDRGDALIDVYKFIKEQHGFGERRGS